MAIVVFKGFKFQIYLLVIVLTYSLHNTACPLDRLCSVLLCLLGVKFMVVAIFFTASADEDGLIASTEYNLVDVLL
jgi:hypothetical protein